MSQFKFWSSIHARRLFAASSALFVVTGAVDYASASESKGIDQVLSQEASGIGVNRREALANQDDSISQWQSGRILIDGEWTPVEELQQHKLAPRVAEYQKRRDLETLDLEGHRRMARWCQEHQMPEMANVHWKAVLASAVDDEQAHKALHHKNIDGKWFTNEELKKVESDKKAQRDSLRVWMPKIRKLVTKLQSTNAQTKIEGMKQLDDINVEGAVASLKFAAVQVDQSTALLIVEKIKNIRSEASCLALCEIAVLEPNSEMGRSATEGLRQYNEHYYVPELLQMLEVPVSIKQQFHYMPNGALVMHNILQRETMDKEETIEFVKLISVDNSPNTLQPTGDGVQNAVKMFMMGSRTMMVEVNALNKDAKRSMNKIAEMEKRKLQVATERINDSRRESESRVKTVLSRISNLPDGSSAEDYWNWWPKYNDSSTAYKEQSRKYLVDDSNYVNLVTNYSGMVDLSPSPPPSKAMPQQSYSAAPPPRSVAPISKGPWIYYECLAAGTQIQTSDGLRNVEDLKVGDSVVSMDVATSEIRMQPVTQVSSHDIESSYAFETSDGQRITATGGHNWWVVGKGWTRTRELTPKMLIRTADSSVDVVKVEKNESTITVYNMTIDQTHTYFVGKDRLLSWDVTSLKPTLQRVPGHDQSKYVSIGK